MIIGRKASRLYRFLVFTNLSELLPNPVLLSELLFK